MAHSSCTKGSISIDLFNLPTLPDERRQTMMFCEIPNDFFLPDGKNSRLSQIINTWTFSRLTPDGNEGVGVEIAYLECAHGMKYYVMDQVNGNINAIHDDSLESTEFVGNFCPFDLEELELKVCKITDCCEGEDDSRLNDDRRQVTQSAPSPQQPSQPKELCPFNELKKLIHDVKVFTTEQCTKLYFSHVERINDLVESYQAYSNLMASQPDVAGEYAVKRAEQVAYYEKILRNVNIVLQMDQVHYIHEGLSQLPSPRYTPTKGELENENLQVILQSAHNDVGRTNKEMQIIQMDNSGSNSRLRNMDDLTDMGFSSPDYSSIPTVRNAVPP